MAAFGRPLLALIVGQIGLHACMAGIRLAAPLLALRAGHTAEAVGLLMALFAAAPIALALQAGRQADRHGYHRPVRTAVALTAAGALLAWMATFAGALQFALLCAAAALAGAGANFGLIAIQRTAGRAARDAIERKQVFSWLGLAPALANVVGPVAAGVLIDAAGFRSAFFALLLLPLVTLWWARQVPVEAARPAVAEGARAGALDLLLAPGMRRLLLVNWLLSTSWDLHGFLLPIIGHERGLSASAIGLILGAFAGAVAAVRLLIPMVARHAREPQVLAAAMLWTAVVFGVYPFARGPWVMGACAVALGLALGCVQPMVMSTLHHITPDARHGEAIALRSMTINLSSTLMPLLFGAAGVALGASALFWMMSASVAAGSWPARRVGA
ncbi:MAG: MFS transporter [Betaproteobacteria bacterium]